MEERSVEESNSEPPTKFLIVDNKEHISTTGQTLQMSDDSYTLLLPNFEENQSSHNLDLSLRPPPPLKAAGRNRGQSLLKNSPTSTHIHNNDNNTAATSTIVTDESKRSWKCKRCNYRDSNKDNVLLHVKSHYDSIDRESTEERVSLNFSM